MTIEIKKREEPVSHAENLFWQALCYTCCRVSEEDGDIIGGPPDTLIGWWEGATYDQALAEAKKHEEYYKKHYPDENHRIVVDSADIGNIKKALLVD